MHMKGKIEKLTNKTLKTLEKIESIIDEEIYITSGFRTIEENARVGGARNSAHLRGLAADIAATDDKKKMKIILAAVLANVKRIGIYENHIHVDILESTAIWSKGRINTTLKDTTKKIIEILK